MRATIAPLEASPPSLRHLAAHALAILAAVSILLPVEASRAGDWPMYRHDPARSGVTPERLAPPLRQAWVHRARHAPRPAWPAPARQDFWHRHRDLQPEVTYDRAYHVVVAGGAVFYGSSADDRITCLDAASGRVRWSLFTEGPVRLAPAVAGGRVYAGSDDGCVYCLDARDGRLVWKRRLAPADRRIPGNGRVISVWPVRTGVLVEGGVAYACAGLFPREGTYVFALRAGDGSILWRRETDRAAPQGYLMATASLLVVPTGRTAPALFDRREGAFLGALDAQGGSFALLTDEVVINAPGRTTGLVDVSDVRTRERIATFRGLNMLVRGERAYLHDRTSIAALDRVRHLRLARERNAVAKRAEGIEKRLDAAKRAGRAEEVRALARDLAAAKGRIAQLEEAMRACFLWRRPCADPFDLILAGDVLFAGGGGEVAAFRASDGARIGSAPVEGRAYGLAAAGGRLYASTDEGAIHCFAAAGGGS